MNPEDGDLLIVFSNTVRVLYSYLRFSVPDRISPMTMIAVSLRSHPIPPSPTSATRALLCIPPSAVAISRMYSSRSTKFSSLGKGTIVVAIGRFVAKTAGISDIPECEKEQYPHDAGSRHL